MDIAAIILSILIVPAFFAGVYVGMILEKNNNQSDRKEKSYEN